MAAAAVQKSQRSSSICLTGSQTFDMSRFSAATAGNNSSGSGSESPLVPRDGVPPAAAMGPVKLPAGKVRQSARRSKSERLQGANKPRVKRRDVPVDLNRANSGSLGGKDFDDGLYIRKVPSVGAGLMNDAYHDTPDGSPRLTGRPVRSPGSRPPLNVSSSNVPAIATPDMSPSLIRRATVNSAGMRSSKTQLSIRNSPVARKDPLQNKRATSMRVRGPSSGLHASNSQTYGSSSRRSTFLDVPDDDDRDQDEDSYRLRSFDLTRKGVVNRGDSFRRRRSRSNSLAPAVQYDEAAKSRPSGQQQPHQQQHQADAGSPASLSSSDGQRHRHHHDVRAYRVAIIGAHGVGKSALVGQFKSSECINAYDRIKNDDADPESVYVMLNGEESELIFTFCSNIKVEMNRNELPDAYVVMYSVIDKTSFKTVEDELARLQNWDALRSRSLIVVGNKIDLVRSRAVSTQDGKCLACAYRAKFMEVSVVINHNVDELLVGILTQIRLKEELQKEIAEGLLDAGDASNSSPSTTSWIRNKGLVRASMKAKAMFTWLFGKDDDQFANCENFQVL